MKVLLITARYPFGPAAEAFLSDEVNELIRQGVNLELLPSLRRGQLRPEAAGLSVRRESLAAVSVLLGALLCVFQRPRQVTSMLVALLTDPVHLPKNLLVVPLGLDLGRRVASEQFDHIHGHWLSTSGTLAWIIHRISGVPFSITAHRWDIFARNLIRPKGRDAQFIRFISESGLRAFQELVESPRAPLRVIHLGVRLPGARASARPSRDNEPFRVASVGNLIPVKGHRYLIDAVATLARAGSSISVDLCGEGYLLYELEEQVKKLAVGDRVSFRGQLPRQALLESYARGDYDCVVLPSVDNGGGEHEGIPVSLMEAMSHRVCVVSTRTGGIPELIEDRVSGLLVGDKSGSELAGALRELETHPDLRESLARRGAEQVKERFEVERTVAELVAAIAAVPARGS